MLPPGYGKRDTIQALALLSMAMGMSSTTIVISPSTSLVNQMVSRVKVREFVQRYQPSVMAPFTAIRHTGVRFNANGEALLSVSAQLIENNVNDFTTFIEAETLRTGRVVWVHVDEVHNHSRHNQWGGASQRLRDAGAYLVG
ncbi:MAG: DEAD/DEAH box helicase family protein, partial [Chloroflexota bacterium]|nr:DEAD/DEAH box helicase family protein [Chloroflexota bacterium]